MGQGLSLQLEWRGRSLEALTVLWKHTRPGEAGPSQESLDPGESLASDL